MVCMLQNAWLNENLTEYSRYKRQNGLLVLCPYKVLMRQGKHSIFLVSRKAAQDLDGNWECMWFLSPHFRSPITPSYLRVARVSCAPHKLPFIMYALQMKNMDDIQPRHAFSCQAYMWFSTLIKKSNPFFPIHCRRECIWSTRITQVNLNQDILRTITSTSKAIVYLNLGDAIIVDHPSPSRNHSKVLLTILFNCDCTTACPCCIAILNTQELKTLKR